MMRIEKSSSYNITLPAIVAGLYVVISLAFAPLSFGVVQLRFAEMFNHLAAFNKRYIYALILGCLMVNLFSPLGIVDVLVGTSGTAIGTVSTYLLTRKTTNNLTRYTIATLCQIPGVLLVSLELTMISKLPFLLTFGSVLVGEFLSMIVGAVVIQFLTTRIDFINGKRKAL